MQAGAQRLAEAARRACDVAVVTASVVPSLAAKGITDTGNNYRAQFNSLIMPSGKFTMHVNGVARVSGDLHRIQDVAAVAAAADAADYDGFLAGAPGYNPCPTAAGKACVILPLGDSITEGCCAMTIGGYRIEAVQRRAWPKAGAFAVAPTAAYALNDPFLLRGGAGLPCLVAG